MALVHQPHSPPPFKICVALYIHIAVTMDVAILSMAAAMHLPVSTGMLGKCVANNLNYA